MFALVCIVYRASLVQIHSLKESVISALYVIPFTLVQVAFEESVFRYSILLLYRKFYSFKEKKVQNFTKILLSLLSSAVFAFMHFLNDFSVLNSNVLLFFYYFACGLYFSILTFRFNSILLPYFLHLFNNLYTFLFFTVGESLSMFYPMFLVDVNPNDIVFLLLNFVPLVLFTEILILLLKKIPTLSKSAI